jgi:cytochrome P450
MAAAAQPNPPDMPMKIEQRPARLHPANVPAELAFEFDMFQLPQAYSDDVHGYWKAVQDQFPPIFWTPAYGGHWVITRAEDIRTITSDIERFSNKEPLIPKGVRPKLIPVQLDPPEHGPFRKILMPYFTPKALVDIEKSVRDVAVRIIDELRPAGGCEFVTDFAGVMPIIVFMHILGLPQEDGPSLRRWVQMISGNNGSEATSARAQAGWSHINAYLKEVIEKRKVTPAPGLMNDIVHAKVDGRALTDAEILSMGQIVVAGGLDTVVTVTSFVAHHLATHAEHRIYLREHPERLNEAVEEFVRRFAPSNLGRSVAADTTYKGLEMRKDEQVMVPFPLFGLDDKIHADPLKVDFSRQSSQHAAFGSGVHMCVGAALARREIRIFLEEWLARIPDFRVRPGTKPSFVTGVVNSISDLHLEWTPG